MTGEPGPGSQVETVFHVPRLNQASVVAGSCCPVPAEAILLPELEMVPGVSAASADWQTAEVRVQHAVDVAPATLADVLADLSYPAEGWHTATSSQQRALADSSADLVGRAGE